MPHPSLQVAAILQTDALRADGLLADAVDTRRRLGWRIHGLLTLPHPAGAANKQPLVQDIHTGAHYRILGSRGAGAKGCRLDPHALNQAGDALRAALQAAPDLVVINRFGTSEAEGDGFTSEFLSLISADIPVLTVVTDRYLNAWRHFIGDDRHELACDATALRSWLDRLPVASATLRPPGPPHQNVLAG